jgi:hypothetical protein
VWWCRGAVERKVACLDEISLRDRNNVKMFACIAISEFHDSYRARIL